MYIIILTNAGNKEYLIDPKILIELHLVIVAAELNIVQIIITHNAIKKGDIIVSKSVSIYLKKKEYSNNGRQLTNPVKKIIYIGNNICNIFKEY